MRQRLQKNFSESITKFSREGDNISLALDEKSIRRYVYGLGKDDVEGYGVISDNLDSHFKEVINLCTLRRYYGKKMDIYINSNFCY
jgi:hypothetical protein